MTKAFSWRSRGMVLLVPVLATLLAPASTLSQSPARSATDECANAPAEWIFCNGFEDGDFAVWDDYDGNPATTNQLVVSPGPFNTVGNHVARLRAPAGRGGADLIKVLPAGYDQLYARWHVQWEPGYDFRASNHGGGLHAGNRSYLGRSGNRPVGNDWFSSWIETRPQDQRLQAYTYYRGMYMDCSNPSGSCWGDFFPCMYEEGSGYCTNVAHRATVLPPVMESGRWYCFEMMMDAGTPSADGSTRDGVLNWWIDGVEIGPWSDLWLRTTDQLQLSLLWINLWFHGNHSVEGILVDDVVVSTERIGCGDTLVPVEAETWGGVKARFR